MKKCTHLAFGAVLILSVIFFACKMNVDEDKKDYDKKFWSQDLTTGKFYRVEADKLAEGDKCIIYGETSANIKKTVAQAMASEYDTVIYPKMMDVFGIEDASWTDEKGKVIATNTMELSDYLGDRNGKLIILLLDIKDGYGPGNSSYTAGYFWAGNFMTQDTLDQLDGKDKYKSNEMDMMYVDCYPGVPGSDTSNSTFAHEMQHLMNFVTTQVTRTAVMDTWIDEGLATAAEYVYLGYHSRNRVGWYLGEAGTPSGLLPQGNNFFVWGNYGTNNGAVLDDYATAYLFFQWLRIQADTPYILNDIICSDKADFNAVTQAASGRIADNYTWPDLLRDWMAANYINASTGRYGYKDDGISGTAAGGLKKYSMSQVKAYTYNQKNKALYAGEGVYSVGTGQLVDASASGDSGTNVKYAAVAKSGETVTDTGVSKTTNANDPDYKKIPVVETGSWLLAYNVSTSITPNTDGSYTSGTETGYLTGKAAAEVPAPMGSEQFSRQVSGGAPIPIGAQDMLRLHGRHGFKPPGASLNLPKPSLQPGMKHAKQ